MTRTPATPTNPARVLRDAATYLEDNGWTQGEFFADESTGPAPACAIGAIEVAIVGFPAAPYDARLSDRQTRTVEHVADLFADYLRGHGFVTPVSLRRQHRRRVERRT
jgi:hypothetical protein